MSTRQARQFERERGAASLAFALGKHPAAMGPRDRADDVETQPGAFDLLEGPRLDAIEAVENPFQLFLRNADAPVLHANPDGIRRRRRHGDADPNVAAR